MVDKENRYLSLARQTELLGISRSSLYYKPIIDEDDLIIMELIDQIYTQCPFYGSRKIKRELLNRHKLTVNRKHVRRLMRLMGISAIYPKKFKHLSDPNKNSRKFPYLLSGVIIYFPNQVWGTDITYIKLEHGCCYLTAIIDWYSRYVVAWELSENLRLEFCLNNLDRALVGNTPQIHNSDLGSHFTSQEYVAKLENKSIQISMDGRGRCMDNIFTERLWRTLKYENVYLKSYADFAEAKIGIDEYLKFYNNERPHQSLNYQTPAQVYFARRNKKTALAAD